MSSVRLPGSVYQRSSDRWAAVTSPEFDPEAGRRRRVSLGTFETREDALEALVRFRDDRVSVDVGRQRLGDYLARWLELVESQVETGVLARRTASGYREAVQLHVDPAIGHVRLGDLNHLTVYDWLTSLRVVKGLSDQTVLRVYRTLHRALADAPLDRNLAALPKHMRPVVRSKKEIIRPTVDEIRAFLAHASGCEQGERLSPLFRLAAVSGMRRGELMGVSWSDVDFSAATVSVVRSVGADRGELFVKEPKSAAGRRLVGIDDETISVLRSHRVRQSEDRLKTGSQWVDLPLGLDLVFRGRDGDVLSPQRVSRSFTNEWVHAGLRSGVTLHSLRHSMASHLVAAGFPLTEVAARMGHSVEVLMRTYARSIDPKAREERMVEAVSAMF